MFPDKASLIFKAITGFESVEGVEVVDETHSITRKEREGSRKAPESKSVVVSAV